MVPIDPVPGTSRHVDWLTRVRQLHERSAIVRTLLAPVISLAVFVVAAVVLHTALTREGLPAILTALRAIPGGTLVHASLFSAASYALLGGIDWMAVRYLGLAGKAHAGLAGTAGAAPGAARDPGRLTYPRVALTSFIAYAFGHNLGLAALTASAIRYRIYSAQGLGMAEVATVAAFCSATTALGLGLVIGVSLLAAPQDAGLLHVGSLTGAFIGGGLLCVLAAFVAWASVGRGALRVAGVVFVPPGPKLAVGQVLVSCLEFCVAGAALWVLLPASAPGFLPFIGVFGVAVLAGLASQVPGGIGVFELAMMFALPHVPVPALLGALLAFRAIYYLAPLLLAALALIMREALVHQQHLSRAGAAAVRWIGPVLEPVTPHVIGALVFIAGCILLVSGATPVIDARLQLLQGVLPLPLLEVSHLLGSVVGVLLLILARALFRRVNAAFHLARALLVAGIVASLAKGIDYEEAMLLAVVLLALQLSRAAFYRPASMLEQRLSPAWIGCILTMVALSVWIGLLAYRQVPYQHDLWWTFAVDGNAPRMLRASFVVVTLAVIVLFASALRLARPDKADTAAEQRFDLQPALRCTGDSLANAALMGDKRILMHPEGDAFVMYAVNGRSWIALGDPVGNPARRLDLAWRFRELADLHLGKAVFYEASVRCLPIYLELGLSLLKLGEEARVELAHFDLDGRQRSGLRQAHRRVLRDGGSFEIVPRAGVDGVLPELRLLSDAWLAEKSAAEKRFSLGFFSEEYLRHFPIAVVRASGRIVAFANIWATENREELSVDLIRFGADAPRGSMDFLFIELMLWGRAEGYRWFNLGMAPLSGVESRALAPAWNRLGRFVFRHGEAFYNFEGLRHYKEKFLPVWEPRYLATPGGIAVPRVLMDITTLISGGLKELVHK